MTGRTPELLQDCDRKLSRALSKTPEAHARPLRLACCNAECGWTGYSDRLCGGVGPLCPDCGEVTEPCGVAGVAMPSAERCAKCEGTDAEPWCNLTQSEYCGRSNPELVLKDIHRDAVGVTLPAEPDNKTAQDGPAVVDCAMCKGRGFYGTPGGPCAFCKGSGKTNVWRRADRG